MKTFIKNISTSLKVLIVAAFLVLGTQFVLADWSEPGCGPTGCNTPAPLNVGPDVQIKSGGLIIANGGVNPGLIVASGNVGIGTIAPAAKLEIGGGGQIKITGGSPGINKVLTSVDASGLGSWKTLTEICTATPGVCGGSATSTNYWTLNGTNNIYNNNTGGLIGIGTNAPSQKLQVAGGNILLDNTRTIMAFNPSGVTKNVLFARFNDDATYLDGGTGGTYLRVNDGTVQGIRIAATTGNVGIGTIAPAAKLNIVGGPVTIGSTYKGDAALQILTSSYGGNGRLTQLSSDNGDPALNIIANGGGLSWYSWGVDTSNIYHLNPGLSLNGASGLSLPASGRVGIATAAPSQALDVNGNIAVRNTNVFVGNGGNSFYGDTVNLAVRMSASGAFYVQHTDGSGAPITASAFYYTSDRNLKKNIAPLQDSLSKILQLQGVSFNWKSNGEPNVGLIAQDVEKVYPELVDTNKETGLKSVEYGNLVAPLIEAVKEQQQQIDDLKKEVEALKQK